MKIIFSDIDGVLNSAYYTARDGGGISAIEERKVKNLKKLLDDTSAQLVICSRANSLLGKDFNNARINQIKEHGVTPLDSIMDIEFQESKSNAINRWLRNHPEVTNFVVFDDCASDLEQQFGKQFIHIKGRHGLTKQYIEQALKMLVR